MYELSTTNGAHVNTYIKARTIWNAANEERATQKKLHPFVIVGAVCALAFGGDGGGDGQRRRARRRAAAAAAAAAQHC